MPETENPLEIPTFPKKDIKIHNMSTPHGSSVQMTLSFTHRKDCLAASRFLTNIVSEMIEDDIINEEEGD